MDPNKSLDSVIKNEIDDAISFIENEIGAQRAESLERFRGAPLGNEEDGRSQIVRSVVRDSVHGVLPSLMRVFFSTDRAVEFVPHGPEDVEQAEQASDYVNHLVRENDGWTVLYSAFKDALYQKQGVVKYWHDESIEVSYHDFTGLTEQGLALVMQEPGTEVVDLEEAESEEESPQGPSGDPSGQLGGVTPSLLNVTVKRTRRAPRIRLACVPPEEFLIDRRARSLDEARYVGHRQMCRVDDLVRMGYDPDFVESKVSHADTFTGSHESWTRYSAQGGYWPSDAASQHDRRVLYCESWLRWDLDEDGLAELVRVCTIGEGHEIVDVSPVDSKPFALFQIDPEPHLVFGQDLADVTKGLMEVETAVMRAILDSLALSVHPRTAVVEGAANLDDVLNTETGAIIRMDAPGMVQPFAVPFVGAPALNVLEMLKTERESRTGVFNSALDPDALQSTTRAAVQAQVDAASQRLELYARNLAEGGMRRLFRGLLRLVCAHQDRAQMVRLRGRWVEIDASVWNASMDATVNVGLGNGRDEEKLAALQQTLQVQQQILEKMGPQNPLVGLGQVRYSLGKLLEFAGYKDTTKFFNPLPPDYQPEPPPPPPPDPAEMLAEVEREKLKADMMVDMQRLQLDTEKLRVESQLKAAEIQAKYGTQTNVALIRDALEREKLSAEN